jgi:hypothetical protein
MSGFKTLTWVHYNYILTDLWNKYIIQNRIESD